MRNEPGYYIGAFRINRWPQPTGPIMKKITLKGVFSDSKTWCKKYYMTNKKGKPIYQYSDKPVAFCLSAAMQYVFEKGCIPTIEQISIRNRLVAAITKLFPTRVTPGDLMDSRVIYHFNDHKDTTFEDLLKVLEKAKV